MFLLSKFSIFNRTTVAAPALLEVRSTFSMATLGSDVSPIIQTIYPPLDPGLPAVEPEQIIIGAKAKIKRLAEIAGGTATEFERLYMLPLRNLAAQIHLLPATPHAHYSAPAGLFNMCLDVALMSRQSAEGKIFVPEATIEVRHRTEGAWKYSAFIAGLLSQLHVPVGTMTVTSPSGDQWPRFASSLYEWLQAKNLSAYHVIWHDKARVTGAEGASLLAKVVPPDVMDWLATTDSQIIRDLNIAVTREMSSSESILGAILKSVVTRVKEVDALHQPSRFGRLCIGTQFEPHLLNAMRELIEQQRWRCNEPGGKIFWGSDGLFVLWPTGIQDVLDVFDRRFLGAMPRSSVTLAELLGHSGVIISKDMGVWVHDIVVKDKSGAAVTVPALRFKEPLLLIGHLPLKASIQPFGKMLYEAQLEQLTLASANLLASPPINMPKASAVLTTQAALSPSDQQSLVQVQELRPDVLKPSIPSAAKTQQLSNPASHLNAPAILVHIDDVQPGSRLSQDVLSRLKIKDTDPSAVALGMALEQSLQYRTDRVRKIEWGVAICTTWLGEVAGCSAPEFLEPLDRAGVIAKNPDGKSIAKVAQVVFSDSAQPRMAIVIKTEFAVRVGMPIDAKV